MIETLVRFACSIVAAYVVALGVLPLLNGGTRRNLLGAGLAVVGISICPALIRPEDVMVRGFSCLLCIDPLFRVYDYARQLRKGRINPVSWYGYCAFLIPIPFLLTVFGQKQDAMRIPYFRETEWLRLIVCLSIIAIALALCIESHQVIVLRQSFVLDHLVKLLLFGIVAEMASQVQVVLERSSGFYTSPIINHAYLARTPAEFWFRYNQRVRCWLYANVFVPCGGSRTPWKGIFAVFLVSATFHEYFFALATSRLDGYQFAFFMLQAFPVILSPRLEQLARRSYVGRVTAHGLTWLWFAVTSPLFFHGLDRVFPVFYASQPWLP